MLLKKIAMGFGLSWIVCSFAGTEDWDGVYSFVDSRGNVQIITHTPTKVQFYFLTSSGCLHFKDSVIYGVEFKGDIHLCHNMDVETFTAEIEKIGQIIDKKITLGPTYT